MRRAALLLLLLQRVGKVARPDRKPSLGESLHRIEVREGLPPAAAIATVLLIGERKTDAEDRR